MAALQLQLLDQRLFEFQVLLPLQRVLHGEAVELLVRLGAQCLDGGTLACIEHPYLNEGLISVASHLSAEGVYLPDQMPLGRTADGGIAGHQHHIVHVHSKQQRAAAHPGCRQRRLTPRMPRAYNDNIVHITAYPNFPNSKILSLSS
jgi:hypothetical protein